MKSVGKVHQEIKSVGKVHQETRILDKVHQETSILDKVHQEIKLLGQTDMEGIITNIDLDQICNDCFNCALSLNLSCKRFKLPNFVEKTYF